MQRKSFFGPLFSLAFCASLASSSALFAQGGLRESLEKLDRNDNGVLEREEITPLARPYLERIARGKRLSLDRENSIDAYQESARIYFALQNGVSGKRVRPEPENSIRSFRRRDEEEMIPEFGLPEVKFPYTQEDLDEADRTLRRSDRNRDNYIDRREAYRAEWTHRNPFDDDLNKDDRLSRLELTQRYARRRLLSDDANELVQKARRTGNDIRNERDDRDKKRDQSEWWRKGGSSYWLAASLLGRFDKNRNGRLESQEAKNLNMPVGVIDADRDGDITRDELQAYTDSLQKDAGGNFAEGLPGWFYELDEDRDGQVAMHEFATEWDESKLTQFSMLDLNEDGLLTEQEVASSKAMMGGAYTNDNAEPLPPFKTVISEIEVTDEFVVQDLNVRLSITHSNVGFLDGYLTGPDGQRIELFTEVGGSGDHFEGTVFNDQAKTPITKARAPFEGDFLPEGLLKKQPSLGHFRGKPAQGVWQLVIRGTRNERFGMLHSWSLEFKAEETMLDMSTAGQAESDPSHTAQIAVAQARENEPNDQEQKYEQAKQKRAALAESWGDFSAAAGASSKLPDDPERRERIERFRKMIDDLKGEDGELTPEAWGKVKGAWAAESGAKGAKGTKGERSDLKQSREKRNDRFDRKR